MKRILVVEDDKVIGEMMAELFIARGFEVQLAHSAPAARELIKRSVPHLIICDLGLPGEYGDTFLLSVLQEYPDVQAIIISGNDETPGMDKRIIELGIPLIPKPFAISDLSHQVISKLS